jgi:hypothetical protein
MREDSINISISRWIAQQLFFIIYIFSGGFLVLLLIKYHFVVWKRMKERRWKRLVGLLFGCHRRGRENVRRFSYFVFLLCKIEEDEGVFFYNKMQHFNRMYRRLYNAWWRETACSIKKCQEINHSLQIRVLFSFFFSIYSHFEIVFGMNVECWNWNCILRLVWTKIVKSAKSGIFSLSLFRGI